MAGRSRTKKNVLQKLQRDAATQTSPEKNLSEVARLQEEVDLLCEKLRQLKQNHQNSDLNIIGKKNEPPTLAVADSPHQEKLPIKGCNCKGKCASRACGCVKKQIPCTAACNCQHNTCKNQTQETDKENIDSQKERAKVSTQAGGSPRLLSRQKRRNNLKKQETEGVAGPSEKQLEQPKILKRSLFSPDSTRGPGGDVSVSRFELDTPIEFLNLEKHVHFNPEASSEDDIQAVDERRKIPKSVKPDGKKTRKESDSSSKKNRKPGKKTVENKVKLPAAEGSTRASAAKSTSDGGKKKKLISVYPEGRETVTESDSSSEEDRKPGKKTVENKLKVSNVKESTEANGVKYRSDEESEKKLISDFPYGKKTRAATSDNEDIEGFEIPFEYKFAKGKENDFISIEAAENRNPNSESLVRRNLAPELDLGTINPMKPTRQLPRTPPSASINWPRVSESPPQYKEPLEIKRQNIVPSLPQPDGIDAAQVDWETHCAQLVPCRLCNRTFYPFRLEKHEANCKKI